ETLFEVKDLRFEVSSSFASQAVVGCLVLAYVGWRYYDHPLTMPFAAIRQTAGSLLNIGSTVHLHPATVHLILFMALATLSMGVLSWYGQTLPHQSPYSPLYR